MSDAKARAERIVLLAILLAAAWLRFAGLAHHVVRGAADFDEQNNFVRPIQRMWRDGSPDPMPYQGYAGLFNWLAFLPVVFGERTNGFAGAYAAARGVVAVFSLLNVLLAWSIARRWAGPAAGLVAAALLAVSRLDVRAAHHVTPDVLVASAVLGVLLLLGRPVARGRDLLSGALVGLATGVKYTGALAGVPVAAALLLERGLKRAPRVMLAAALSFALAAPYAVAALAAQGLRLSGAGHYYGEKAERVREAKGDEAAVEGLLAGIVQAVGPVGIGLALLAPVLARERRALGPALAVVAASFAAVAPAAYVFPRHALPPAAVVAALAGAGLALLARRAGRAGTAVAILGAALALPSSARSSWELVGRYLRPSAVDRAAEWIERERRGPAQVIASLPRLVIDTARFEVRRTDRLGRLPLAALAQFDLVVSGWTHEVALHPELRVLARFPSEDGVAERSVSVLGPPEEPRLRLEPTAVAGRGFIELRWSEPCPLARVELDAPEPVAWPLELLLRGDAGDGAWQALRVEALRPRTRQRQRPGTPRGQAFAILEERALIALRIERRKGGGLGLAAVRLYARPGPPAAAALFPREAPTRTPSAEPEDEP